jgi:predicted transcriptional regulator
MYLKVEESNDLVRDSETGAVLNVNNKALQAYKNQKKQFQKINQVESRLDKIENLLLSLQDKLDRIGS